MIKLFSYIISLISSYTPLVIEKISFYTPLVICGVITFILTDFIMEKFKINGRYYMNHFITNSIVVYNTFTNMTSSYNIDNVLTNVNLDSLYYSKSIIYSLHIYHMLWYYKSLRYDDWLHHLLMVGVSLPLTEVVPQNHLIGHCLFFMTGLPGLIDYFMLFLTRNNLMLKNTEKKINSKINLWVRCPGCIMNVALCITNVVTNYNIMTNIELFGSYVIMGTVYWNGIYFMNQVVTDNILNENKNI